MYRAPLRDMQFVLHELLGDERQAALYRSIDYSGELADTVLEEAAKFAENVLEPLNKTGDQEGARWTPEGVRMPKGFREAYAAYAAAGWSQLGVSEAEGGQGMPLLLNTAVEEIMFAANMAFYLGTSLGKGEVEAISASGSAAQKALLLPKLVSGEWMGTMNLTEAQAGSDLALIRTRAVADGDPDGGRYRLFGQKIFITYGDHDMADNIVHLVLARIDGAPPGVRGISMFFVPKYLINADGTLGKPNDLRCISIEHKLGIHASPTCVMSYGEKEGAIGYLLGEPNTGLAHMFIMMNAARLSVGVQGIAQSERALQQALDWARNRLQGKPPGDPSPGPLAIINHPDVKRMLLSMKARTEAMRALAYTVAMALDIAHRDPDETVRAAALIRGELLIPIVKGWCTETGIQVASTGVQVHGGMGFIEETGAAQTLRDVRITAIYEGTTAIQSNDLVGRKLGRDRGQGMNELIRGLLEDLNGLRANDVDTKSVKNSAIEALTLLRDVSESLLQLHTQAPARALAVSVPYLELCGLIVSGALMAKSAAVAAMALPKAAGSDAVFYQAKLRTARFYADQVLPAAYGLARVVKSGAASVFETDASTL
ncbi:MAG: acyl-CoA dehydrogenase [Pseudomonadota bacterium]